MRINIKDEPVNGSHTWSIIDRRGEDTRKIATAHAAHDTTGGGGVDIIGGACEGDGEGDGDGNGDGLCACSSPIALLSQTPGPPLILSLHTPCSRLTQSLLGSTPGFGASIAGSSRTGTRALCAARCRCLRKARYESVDVLGRPSLFGGGPGCGCITTCSRWGKRCSGAEGPVSFPL